MGKNNNPQNNNVPEQKPPRTELLKPAKNSPNPNETIALSKQLLEKRNILAMTSRRRCCRKRRFPRKPMPTLADLEKMFDDRNNDSNVNPPNNRSNTLVSTAQITQVPTAPDNQASTAPDNRVPMAPHSQIPTAPVSQVPMASDYQVPSCSVSIERSGNIKNMRKRKRCTTHTEITPVTQEQQSIMHNLARPQENTVRSPPIKQRRTATGNEISADLPAVTLSESNNVIDRQINSHGEPRTINTELNLNTNNQTVDVGHLSDSSTDSNKTIEYRLPPSSSHQNESNSSHNFSPLPSTSRDNNTFMKNDELFTESLNETYRISTQQDVEDFNRNTRISNEIMIIDDVMVVQEPLRMIKIGDDDDEIDKIKAQNRNVPKTVEEVQAIFAQHKNPSLYRTDKRNSKPNDQRRHESVKKYEDDDCIFVKTEIMSSNPGTSNSRSRGLEYSSNINIVDEIIDVDALVARNNSAMGTTSTNIPNRTSKQNVINVSLNNQTSSNTNPISSSQTAAFNSSKNGRKTDVQILEEACQNLRSDSGDEIDLVGREEISREARRTLDIFARRFPEHLRYRLANDPRTKSTQISGKHCALAYFINRHKIEYLNRRRANRQALSANTPQANSSEQSSALSCETATTIESSESNSESETQKSIGDCPICMDRLSGKALASTICGHVFCMKCLETAIKNNKKCPTCRMSIKNKGYHQLFL